MPARAVARESLADIVFLLSDATAPISGAVLPAYGEEDSVMTERMRGLPGWGIRADERWP
jgi:hypothetical protein